MAKTVEPKRAQKFRETARERETDDSEENFNARLKHVVKEAQPREEAPPSPDKKVAKSPAPKDDKKPKK